MTGLPDICGRCGRPVFQSPATGRWQRAKVADAAFCELVMRAPERAAARDDPHS